MKKSRNDRNQSIKFVLPLVGFCLVLAFQNFSPSDRSLFLKPSQQRVLPVTQTALSSSNMKSSNLNPSNLNPSNLNPSNLNPSNLNPTDPKVAEAYRFADFLSENLGSMSDDEIIGRISDRIFTSIEIAKMEEFSQDAGAKDAKTRSQYMEKIARDLEKDSKFQKSVIAHVRLNGHLR